MALIYVTKNCSPLMSSLTRSYWSEKLGPDIRCGSLDFPSLDHWSKINGKLLKNMDVSIHVVNQALVPQQYKCCRECFKWRSTLYCKYIFSNTFHNFEENPKWFNHYIKCILNSWTNLLLHYSLMGIVNSIRKNKPENKKDRNE